MNTDKLTQSNDQAGSGQARRPDPWDAPCPQCGYKGWPRWRGRYVKGHLELRCVKCGFKLRA